MWLRKIVDHENPESITYRLRRKRFAYFRGLLASLPPPIRILDVGGTEAFWVNVGGAELPGIQVVLANLYDVGSTLPNFSSIACDARDMKRFADDTFDVVFSNSVIEHLSTYENQRRMASEMQRVGRRCYVQTPNRYFPIEPHFLFPFFQFFPQNLQVWIACHWKYGWYSAVGDPAKSRAAVEEMRLLSERELKELFPGARIRREYFGGIAKSLVAVKGW